MEEKNYIQYFCDDTLDDIDKDKEEFERIYAICEQISDEICSKEFDLSY